MDKILAVAFAQNRLDLAAHVIVYAAALALSKNGSKPHEEEDHPTEPLPVIS